MTEKSTFLKHESCPKCGSANNLARYSDGHAHCFSNGCGYYERGNGTASDFAPRTPTRAFEMTGVIAAIPDRRISQGIAQKFGVTVEFSPEGQIVKHHYPYYDKDNNKPTGTKVRQVETKGFYATGNFDNVGLFGQQAFREGGKYITITTASGLVVSDQAQGDERKAIDSIMTNLRKIVQETGVGLFLVSHLRRPSGQKAHEDGGKISLGELRGSAAIAQLSDMVIGLERDQQHADPETRNTTCVRVLKNRFVGLTGAACYLYYDKESGRMIETSCPTEDNVEF
jgi:ribosomal protein S27AE